MRATLLRRAGALAFAGALGAVTIASSGASASADHGSKAGTAKATISAFTKGKNLGFEGPRKVESGAQLTIVNDTDPEMVGPHTFTLLKKKDLPKSNQEMKDCYKLKSELCQDIAKAHKANAKKGTVKKPDVDVGKKGWDRSFGKKGDSWFTEQEGESTARKVSAKPGTTLYYFCVIHPFMEGKIKVVK